MVLKNCPGRGPMILKIDTPRRILSATPSAGCGRGTGASETIWSPLLVIVGRSALLGPRHAAAAGGVDGFPRNKYRRCPIRESSCVIGVSVVLTDTHQERRQYA